MQKNILLGGASVVALTMVASFWGTTPASALPASSPTCAANGGGSLSYPYSAATGDVIVCTVAGTTSTALVNNSANNVQFSLSSGAGLVQSTVFGVPAILVGNNASLTVASGATLDIGGGKGTAFQAGTGLTALIMSGGTVSGTIVGTGSATVTVAGTASTFAGFFTAINLSGDNNRLILNPGYSISGSVIGGTSGATSTVLELGGTGSGSFDVSQLGNTYTNFAQFQKTGTSTWTLVSTPTKTATPWTISGGTLSVATDSNLGFSTDVLTLNGGTLKVTSSTGIARTISVASGGGTIDTPAATTVSVYGFVTGSGPLTVTDSGTLGLGAVDTYSGTLTINAGSKLTLISNEGAPSSIVSASLVDNGTFDITGISTSGTTIASLSGSGTVTLGSKSLTVTNGSGIFTGTMTGTAAVTLTGGQLSVNGTTQNIITIGSGGTLKGIGTVGGFTANGGGTVAPGNSIGTLNVAGNFSFATGSTYQVEVNAAGGSDKIIATGTATISSGATVSVVAAAGSYAASTSYTIINATGGVTGTFGSVTSNLAFLTPSLSYAANSVSLTLVNSGAAFTSVAVTPNQKASAGALQALGAGTLYNAILVSSTANALAGFDAASGEIHATLLASQYEAATSTRRTVLDRMTHLEIGQGVSLWGSLSNDWGNIKTDGNAAANARTGVEFTVGVDTAVTDHWRVGAEGGYDGGSLSAAARSSHVGLSQGHMGVYGVIDYQPVVLRGLVSYSTGSAMTARTIAFTGFSDTATAKQDTRTTQLYGEAAYDIALDSVTLEPFAGLSWTNIYAGAFHETGGAAALAGASRSLENSYVTAGLQATPQVFDLAGVNLSPMLRVALQHSFTNRTVSRSLTFLAGGPAFTVLGTQLDSDRALVDAGVTANVNETVNVSLGYYGAFGSRGNDHAVKLLGELKL